MGVLEIAMIDDLTLRIDGVFNPTVLSADETFSVGDIVVPFMSKAIQHTERNFNVCRTFYPAYIMQYSAVSKNVWAYCGKASSTATTAVLGLVYVDGERMIKIQSVADKTVVSGGVVNVVTVGTSIYFMIESSSGSVNIWHSAYDANTNTLSTPASVGSIPFTFLATMFHKVQGTDNVFIVGPGGGTDTVTFIKLNEGGTILQNTFATSSTKYLQSNYGHLCFCPTTNMIYGHGYYSTEYAFRVSFDTDSLTMGSVGTMSLPAGYTTVANRTMLVWYDQELDAIAIVKQHDNDANTCHLFYVDPASTSTLKGPPPVNLGKEAIASTGQVSRVVDFDGGVLFAPSKDNPKFLYSVEKTTKKVRRYSNPLVSKSGVNTNLFISHIDFSLLSIDNHSTYEAITHAVLSAYVSDRAKVIAVDNGIVEAIAVESEVGKIKRIENIHNTAAVTLRLSPFNVAKTVIEPPIQVHSMDVFVLAANSYTIVEYR